MSAIRALRFFVLVTALAALSTVAGCKAGRGDTCKEANDCSGSLACCKPSFAVTARGTCEDRAMCPSGVIGSAPVDSSVPDSSVPDGAPDGGAPDGSLPDATPDATPDGGAPDAAVDATPDADPSDADPADADPSDADPADADAAADA